jgi:hypothetical protein
MARHKMVDGVRLPLTQEEEDARDLEEQQWEAGAFDRAIGRLRSDRTQRLSATDWYALQDVTLSPEMRTYRQVLRDLPSGLSTVEEVENVSWPVKPAE